ncbi:MAG: L,D-transpeptidase [Verrucomicrobiota bacterium]|nr:L,D-transpeptidase [Verrucomicrobiota bacterium]
MRRLSLVLLALSALAPGLRADGPSRVIISVKDQKLMLMGNGTRLATYPISTSKFGLGDDWGHMTTPLGFLQVAEKIGDHAPVGAVFRNRRFTGEIIKPNAPGRDPVITRIIWLKGLEASNAHAFSRCIYIHGTPEEKTIGRPASYGCIRMKSRDVEELYAQLPIGALVEIVNDKLPKIPKAPSGATFALEQRNAEPKAEPEPAEPEPKAKQEPKAEPKIVAEAPVAPVEKPAKKPVRKNLKEQPHFGRSA